MDRRVLVDTNIVVYLAFNQKELDNRVSRILTDDNNLFFVSAVSVQELIHLFSIGKMTPKQWKHAREILPAIKAMHFQVLPVKDEHLAAYAELTPLPGHKDPNDHVIISQAIAERMTLISSDGKFEDYTRQGLRFIFNER